MSGAARAGIAVDVGGTKIESAESAAPDAVHRIPTRVDEGAAGLTRQVLSAIDRWAPRPGERIVVASAGHLDRAAGRVISAANLPWRDHPLVDTVAAATGCEPELVGDATAATLAELAHPSRARHRDGLYVTMSTGIGMGVIRDGLLDWQDGTGDRELGHLRVATGDDAARCGCGRRGCLEAYSSGAGIVRRYRDLTGGAGAEPSVSDVAAAAEHGDPAARLVLDQALDYLATALAAAVTRVRATILVLGGGVLRQDGLFGSLHDRLRARLGPGPVVERSIHGAHSTLYGAAAMCEREPRVMAALARDEEGVR